MPQGTPGAVKTNKKRMRTLEISNCHENESSHTVASLTGINRVCFSPEVRLEAVEGETETLEG